MPSTGRPDISGFSHLVEAATALTELIKPPESKPQKVASSVVSDEEDRTRKADSKSTKKKEIFPQTLMEILSDAALSEVVTWLPHGRSFVIIRPDVFTEQVLPKYLPPVDSRASTKYPSFTRKLNRWGFRQATRGPDTGAFHHELFRRDQPELCLGMVCQKSRDRPSMARDTTRAKSVSSRTSNPRTRIVSDSSNSSSTSDESSSIDSTSPQGTDDRPSPVNGPPKSILSGGSCGLTGPLPFISNDAEFVTQILLQREREEVLKASKAILYDAFLKASGDSKAT